MASYLVITHNNKIKSYEVQTSHNTKPYLVVNSTGFLDLTTRTITGLQLKIKKDEQIYRPIQTYTTTEQVNIPYVETTGYSGISSKESTSGYSGSLSKSSTSGYTGSLSRASTSGYTGISSKKTNTSIASHLYSRTATSYRFTADTVSQSASQYRVMYETASRPSGVVNQSIGEAEQGTSTYDWQSKSNILDTRLISLSFYFTANQTRQFYFSDNNIDAHQDGFSIQLSALKKYNTTPVNYLPQIINNSIPFFYTMTFQYGLQRYGIKYWRTVKSITSRETMYYGYSYINSSSNQIANLSSTTALTRASNYATSSSAVGNLSSTTALTRVSYYATSSNTIGNLSSTTALTRASEYNTSSSTTNAGLSSVTALTHTTQSSSKRTVTVED